MPIARPNILAAIAVAAAACQGGTARYSGNSELVWPGDPRADAYLVFAGWSGPGRPGTAWPRTVGEICAPVHGAIPAPGGDPALEALRLACGEAPADPPHVAVSAAFGAFGVGKTGPLGEIFEHFGGNWYSLRTDAEQARAWTRMPALVDVELRHGFSPRAFAYFRAGLRRDLAAWHADDLSLNLPLAAREVDLNEPSLGYFHYEGEHAGITAGRFPVQWSPSPDMGLALSGSVPHFDGIEAAFKMPRLTYRFLIASLNPWLEGTPSGNASSEDYPEGSEEWRQRHYRDIGGANNAHRRVYDARIKTLVAHRLETWAGPVILGVTETNIIGGKVPDFKDANPFAVFHNDFQEGYSNNNVSVDALVRLPLGVSLAAEVFMDDLEYSDTEGSGGSPSLLGWLGALRHSFRAGGWAFSHSLHGVWTDPFLYGFQQPLNTYASRHILTTNYADQDEPLFYDKLVVDYPIGYLRGGDALDVWYRLDAVRGRFAASLAAARLSRGEADLHTPFERYYLPHGSAPSGVAEEELRLILNARAALGKGLIAGGGLAVYRFLNREHLEGADDLDLRLAAWFAWTLPH